MDLNCSARNHWTLCACLGFLGLLLATGCGGPSEDVPPSELRQQIVTMSTDELRSLTSAYREAYHDCRQQMETLRVKIRSISAGNPRASRLTTLSKSATEISRRMERLLTRHQVCYEALSRRGASVEDLGID